MHERLHTLDLIGGEPLFAHQLQRCFGAPVREVTRRIRLDRRAQQLPDFTEAFGAGGQIGSDAVRQMGVVEAVPTFVDEGRRLESLLREGGRGQS